MNYRQRRSIQDRRHRWLKYAVIGVCLCATVIYLRSRLWVYDLSYEFDDLRKELVQLKDQNARLRLEVGKLKSPARLEKIAGERLGLKSREKAEETVTVVLTHPLRQQE